jgi:glutathione S-transferase
MQDFIIHHYPQSPVSEKIRVAMGLKNLAWRSVEQNRLPERPELLAMTGGYRRLPVLQIGADIYCDTQLIFREIERRMPEPSLFPSGEHGLAFGLSRWTDSAMFDLAMRVSFAPLAEKLPPALVADRTRLYLGPGGDLKKEAADLPHVLAQLRQQLGWLDAQLASGHPYLFGDKPGIADLLAWFIVWFLRGRNPRADQLLAEFPALLAWEARVKNIGHGMPSPMAPAEALSICKAADPATVEKSDPLDPQGLAPGMRVAVAPISVGGEAAVAGDIIAVDRDTIAVRRSEAACGIVAVHFPRVGYRVTVL